MVKGCIDNDFHIPVLYGKFVERTEAAGRFKSLGLSIDDLFKSCSSLKALNEAWLIAEIQLASDMTVSDLAH